MRIALCIQGTSEHLYINEYYDYNKTLFFNTFIKENSSNKIDIFITTSTILTNQIRSVYPRIKQFKNIDDIEDLKLKILDFYGEKNVKNIEILKEDSNLFNEKTYHKLKRYKYKNLNYSYSESLYEKKLINFKNLDKYQKKNKIKYDLIASFISNNYYINTSNIPKINDDDFKNNLKFKNNNSKKFKYVYNQFLFNNLKNPIFCLGHRALIRQEISLNIKLNYFKSIKFNLDDNLNIFNLCNDAVNFYFKGDYLNNIIIILENILKNDNLFINKILEHSIDNDDLKLDVRGVLPNYNKFYNINNGILNSKIIYIDIFCNILVNYFKFVKNINIIENTIKEKITNLRIYFSKNVTDKYNFKTI